MFRIIFLLLFITCQFTQQLFASELSTHHIFVSILPQKYFAERLAGEHVQVSVMVGQGQNPATYEPTAKQMILLAKSQLYFQIGVPFESLWLSTIGELNPGLKIIGCCSDLNVINNVENSHYHHAEKKHTMDPHIWTSPAHAKALSLKIKKALVDNYPMYEQEFALNYSRLIEDLDQLDRDIRLRLAGVNNRYMVVSHPSWGYYAQDYNLIQLPIAVEGKEVHAKAMLQLIEFARSKNINRVFVQKQFNNNSAKIIAREINAELIELDPLAEDYIANLYYVTDAISNRRH